ncbi:MAG: FeoA family protein [Paraclostridium sordellii]
MTVYDLRVGQKGIIDNIYGNEKLAKRLLALGCTNDTEIEVRKIAPLGDPILVRFRGFDLAIRKNDAKYKLKIREVST